MTTLYITVGEREPLRESALDFVATAESGELDETDDSAVLQFGSYAELVENITPLRLALAQAIAEHHPESMREAARLVDRDISDVHTDLKHMEVLGVLELEEGGPSGAVRPVVPFDRIEMRIDYPLVEHIEGDETAASAD